MSRKAPYNVYGFDHVSEIWIFLVILDHIRLYQSASTFYVNSRTIYREEIDTAKISDSPK